MCMNKTKTITLKDINLFIKATMTVQTAGKFVLNTN